MVEAAILIKLLSVYILDIYKVLEHIDMLSICVYGCSLTQLYPPYLAQIMEIWVTVIGHGIGGIHRDMGLLRTYCCKTTRAGMKREGLKQ